ncbi:S8 family peptidase [Ekhidna sp.]
MRGVVLTVVLIIWFNDSFGQQLDRWERFISKDSTLIVESDIYIIESSFKNLKKIKSTKILRKLDSNHFIISSNSTEGINKIWKADDSWKIDVDRNSSGSKFYIITTNSFDRSKLDLFRIISDYGSLNTILIEGSLKNIENILLKDPDILHISNKVFKPSVESRVLDMNLNPNRINKIHHFYPNLNGNTEVISIQENRYDEMDIDLLGRSTDSGLESETTDNHATEMATIIAGKGNSFVTGRGVADELTISSSDFSDVMPDSNDSYLNLGVITQNHSYGIPGDTTHYGVEARAFDQSAFNNKNLLHVFSSGNEGNTVSTTGMYQGIEGYANLTGNFKMSKNSLVVGSVDTVGNIPGFVSRGPAYDGRIKPEIVAYSVVGSSNSAALVSGISSLLQQQFREDNSSDMPSSLTKALLINGALDVGPEGLDYITGYGNVNAWKSLTDLRNAQYFSGSVDEGSIESFELNIPDNATNLKITLCWNDPPANVNDFSALVNNLNLRLIDDETTTLPWILDNQANVTSLSSAATRGIDNLNNVEQVTIEDPKTNYQIEVEGKSIAGTQEFNIAWGYEIEDSFEWDYPTRSDNMPYNGETGSYFRWTTSKTGIGELSYTVNEIDWIILESAIDLSKGYWRWSNPPEINDKVKARIQIDAETFETDFFTVSFPVSTSVGFNCSDSLMLRWDVSPNAVDYTIYSLADDILEPFQTVTDTFLIIPNTNLLDGRRFTIEPNLEGSKSLLSTPSFDYTLQGVECYVFSFFQTVALDTGIYLNLTLGTTYGIDEIVFERNELSTFIEIGAIQDFQSDEYLFLDEMPNQGYNEHRIIIRFINGEELILSAGTSFYLTEIPVRVFPNPISVGESLNIITKEFEERTPTLQLIDSQGAIVYESIVQGTQDALSTSGLRAGIYLYRLFVDGQIHTGRILIR